MFLLSFVVLSGLNTSHASFKSAKSYKDEKFNASEDVQFVTISRFDDRQSFIASMYDEKSYKDEKSQDEGSHKGEKSYKEGKSQDEGS